jgi:hypothetical protein
MICEINYQFQLSEVPRILWRDSRRCIGCQPFGTSACIVQSQSGSGGCRFRDSLGESRVLQERAFPKQYCQTYHNAKLKIAELQLDTVDLGAISRSGDILERVVRKGWSGSMPTASAPRPDKVAVKTFLTSLETRLDQNALAHLFAGRPTMLHRLNRTEYLNAGPRRAGCGTYSGRRLATACRRPRLRL